MSATTASTRPTWRIPRPPLEDWLFITLCGWVATMLGVVAIGNLIDHWAWLASRFGQEVNDITVTYSIWSVIAGIALWFVGFLGGYYVHNYLPAFVANGQTRRDAAIGTLVFTSILSGTVTVLVIVGYVWERIVYSIAGWSRGTPNDDLLATSFDDYGRLLVANLLALVLWVTGGALIGSSFYRGNTRGAIGVAIALIAMSLVGGNDGLGGQATIFTRQFDVEPSLPLTITTTITCMLAMAAITWWWNLRELPLRNK